MNDYNSKKILLIFPTPISEMPTGFAYLSSVLKEKGYAVKAVVNTFNHFLKWDEIVRITEDYKPSVVGFNIGTFRVLGIYETIRRIKRLGITVIAGGPHATSCPEEVLENGADIVVRNEGEVTLAELCDFWDGKRGLSLKSIDGISFKDHDGKIFHNPPRGYISDLSYLPAPDFTCFDQERFRTSDGLLKGLHRVYCSRGCPAGCTFCDRAVFGRTVRYRHIEDVVKEIGSRRKMYDIGNFVIADDTFTFNKKYVQAFCKALKDNHLDIAWSCSTRANIVDSKMLGMMKEAGCYMVSYGIESGDPETLKMTNKGITLEQAHKAVDYAAALNYRIYVNLMTGFPWEDGSAVSNNINYIKKHFNQVYIYQVSGALVPYPGTAIYEEYKDRYGFEKWWLREECQNYGVQIHQNVENPYKHSMFYQRWIYDDTYIWEETFFPYTRKYKAKVKEMAFLIGRRNLIPLIPSPINRWIIYMLCKVSHFIYEINPHIEKMIVSKIVSMLRFKSRFHDRGPLGYFHKKKGNSVEVN